MARSCLTEAGGVVVTEFVIPNLGAPHQTACDKVPIMNRTDVLEPLSFASGFRPFPCLDDSHHYFGCIGVAACPVDRCWNGRRLHADSTGRLSLDAFDRPVQVNRYTACKCPTCINAVDVAGAILSAAGRPVERWTTCRLGLWAGPVSIYNLVNRRIPLKHVGPCQDYVPAPDMRPEVAKKREEDRERTRQWKLTHKRARLPKAS